VPTSGFRKLDQQLAQLAAAAGPGASKRVMKSALNFALTPAQKMAKAKAPVGDQMHKTYKGRLVAPGFLSRSIGKVTFQTREGVGVGLVGPQQEAFYGTTFLERGTRYIDKTPWLEPAFNASQDQILRRFADKLAERIDKEVKR
jgi:HK97 gp10 family phage protein